jgi:hypothetical protein
MFSIKSQMLPRGIDLEKAKNTSQIDVWSSDMVVDRTSDGRPLRLMATLVNT